MILTGRDLEVLEKFPRLELVVLDSNRISSDTKFPRLPTLHTLWLNKNKVRLYGIAMRALQIENLAVLVDKLVASTPNLRHLSLLQNEACPNYFTGGTAGQYRDYR